MKEQEAAKGVPVQCMPGSVAPEERAANIIRRCWSGHDKLAAIGEPDFKGLDVEIAAAIREAEAAAAIEAQFVMRQACLIIVASTTPIDRTGVLVIEQIERAIRGIVLLPPLDRTPPQDG